MTIDARVAEAVRLIEQRSGESAAVRAGEPDPTLDVHRGVRLQRLLDDVGRAAAS
jgi:hypothetical protein